MSGILVLPSDRIPLLEEVHHVPLHFSNDGVSKVSSYFVPREIGSGSTAKLGASLRGRSLEGFSEALPTGTHVGILYRELHAGALNAALSRSRAKKNQSGGSRRQFMGDDDSDHGDGSENDGSSDDAGRPERAWVVDGTFKSITTWTHDTQFTEHSVVPRALEWLSVAKALHGVVENEKSAVKESQA
jgi:hypothetical protein